MSTAADRLRIELLKIVSAEVGVREEGGNNRGASIVEYQKATWLRPDPWPWCAAFCAWALRAALESAAGPLYLGDRNQTSASFRCLDASAFGWVKWAQKQGLTVFDENSPIKPIAGDLIVFDFSHIGVVIGPQARGSVPTIEGNTNGKGERDSVSGDGVWRKQRAVSLVKNYIRL